MSKKYKNFMFYMLLASLAMPLSFLAAEPSSDISLRYGERGVDEAEVRQDNRGDRQEDREDYQEDRFDNRDDRRGDRQGYQESRQNMRQERHPGYRGR